MARPAAVIVTYNSEDVIADCLQALAKLAPEMRIIVVDNASTDSTVAAAQAFGVEVIANSQNLGFAAAANQGVNIAADAPIVLLMNPDVSLQTQLGPLQEATEKHGLAGGRLTAADGSTQQGFTIRSFPTPATLALELLGINRLWTRNPWNREYRYLDRDLAAAGPADQPAGAFLMFRRDVWEKLGGFNESFWPIWFEDVDFCYRAAAAGRNPWYIPQVSASHLGGHSIKRIDTSSKQLYWYDNLLRYADLHFGNKSVKILCLAGAVGAVPRALVGMAQDRNLQPIINCIRNLKFLGKRLLSHPPHAG